MRVGRSPGLATRVAIAGLVVAIVLTIVLVVSLAALGDVRARDDQARRSSDTIQAAGVAQSQVLNLETGLRGYVITRDRLFLQPYERARSEAPATVRRLERLAADDPRQAARARLLRAAIVDYAGPYASRVIAGVGRGGEGALAREGKSRVDAIRALIGALTTTEEAEQSARRAEADRSSRRATVVGIGGLVLLFAVFGIVLVYTARVIVGPVTRLTRAARELRGGDLHARVPERSAAELGELEQTFNAMAAALEARTEELEHMGASRAAMLDAVFAQSPVGLAFFEPGGALLRANAALHGMHGLLAEPPAAHAPLGPVLAEAVAGVAASGEPATDLELAGESREGARQWWRASLFPVRPTGTQVAAVGAVIVEITAERLRAETVRRRLEFERIEAQRTARLDQLGEALGEAVSVDQAATVVVSHAIRALDADAGLIVLVDEIRGDLALQAAVGHTNEDLARWRRISRSRATPAVEALRRRAPIAITDPGDLRARWPSMAAAGIVATLTLPLALDDLDVGALSLSWTTPRTFAADELAFIARLADRAAQALQRARLYEREHDIAEVLQRSLLPEALPELPGATLSSRFRASGTGTIVGGDFYDAFALDDARWLAWIGDVCGKGPHAAAIAALARYTVRAEARHHASPSGLIATLDGALQRHGSPEERFLTAICALAQPTASGLSVALAVAGHPPPLLLQAGGLCHVVQASGPLVGLPGATWQDHVLELDPGDRLVLYTDGVTEAGAPARVQEPAELCEALRTAAPRTLEDVLDVLFALALGRPGVLPRDDIALLAIEAGAPVRAAVPR